MEKISCRVLRPYDCLASAYDVTLGMPAFRHTRRGFETLVHRYGIRFASAADIGCGTGLFAYYLSRRWGVPVFAVDQSLAMLRVAERRCRPMRICCLRQDIRHLSLPAAVDLITANFDTLNHLVRDGDLPLTFRRVSANLRPGGHFIFDLVTSCRPLGGSRSFIRCLCAVGYKVLQEIHWEPQRRALSVVVRIRTPGSSSPALEIHQERAYSPAAVGRWLRGAGFIIRGVHDAVTFRVAMRCPPRIIVIAQRRT
jgi:SAM-dependent methyltransferase